MVYLFIYVAVQQPKQVGYYGERSLWGIIIVVECMGIERRSNVS